MIQRLLPIPFLVLATVASAKDIEVEPTCTGATCQEAFQAIAEDIIATIDYKSYGPAEATGLTGVGVGVVATWMPIDSGAQWQQVTGEDFSGLGLVGLQVTKGLPLNLDVGAFYTTIPGASVDVYGGELRYAILPGSTTSPALAVRASYVTVSGIDDFDVDSKSVELALSKGFGPITPFVAAGYVWGSCDPDSATGLSEAKVEETKANVGVRLSLGLLEVTPQAGTVGDRATYGLRLGFSF